MLHTGKFLIASSARTLSASAVIAASPTLVHSLGVVSVTGSALVALHDTSACPVPGTEKWTLLVSASGCEQISFAAPLAFQTGLVVNVTGGSAMLSWSR